MAASQTIIIRDRSALTESESIIASLNLDRLNPRIGAAETLLFQNHFLKQPSNKMGFPSTHLYAQFARATNFQTQSDGVTISVNHVAARQRYEGGLIKPTGGKKYLTIPANAEAYEKGRAGEFNNLRFAFVQGRPALVKAEATPVSFGRKKKDGSRTVKAGQASDGLTPFFWLVRQANQKGDPSIVPSEREIGATAVQAAKDFVLRTGGTS